MTVRWVNISIPVDPEAGSEEITLQLERVIEWELIVREVTIVHEDGTVGTVLLDCSADRFIDLDSVAAVAAGDPEIGRFVEELAALADSGLSFRSAMKKWCSENEVRPRVREFLAAAMEAKQ